MFRGFRLLSAAVFGVAVVFHASAIMTGKPETVRHAAFALVNAVLAAALVVRPRWALWPTLLLGAQQLASHGALLSQSFVGTGPLDRVSLAVCLFFPTLATALFIERQDDA
jgi:hypothetical protein